MDIRWLRVGLRLLLFGIVSSFAVCEYGLLGSWRKGAAKHRYQAGWLHRYLKPVTRLIGIRVHRRGSLPKTPLIVSNHLSYIDIFLLGSIAPLVFLSKDEVKKWPWGGLLATCGGTIYMDRLSRKEVLPAAKAVSDAVNSGLTVVMFLEGTTTDGSEVLPFSSALLEPAVQNKWSITPCHLSYSSSMSPTADGVSWHGDVGFLPHLIRMLKIKRIDATAVFNHAMTGTSRKKLADDLHREVSRLGRLAQRVPEPLE